MRDYVGTNTTESEVSPALTRLAYASVASMVIIPMQDLLNLDERARMNLPATISKNWAWRLKPGEIEADLGKRLKTWAFIYDRQRS